MYDLDKLTLKEYDDLYGVKRKYISSRKMAYIRQRAKDRQREKTAKLYYFLFVIHREEFGCIFVPEIKI